MSTGPYVGQRVALATLHGKDEAIAPVFHDVVGLLVEVIDIDTDAFGTFTGEIPRIDSPIDTAIAKARAGMLASGRTLGLASEGSIGPDPLLPFTTADIETIVFLDDLRNIVISETIRSTDIVAVREKVSAETDLAPLIDRADFPRHGLIVRPSRAGNGPLLKGITDESALVAAIRECSAMDGGVLVESDLRAHYSPSRMSNIRKCAEQLAQRIVARCPECESPGWGPTDPARGLPCSLCGTDVASAVRADTFGCAACPAFREVPRPELTADPRWCPSCNP